MIYKAVNAKHHPGIFYTELKSKYKGNPDRTYYISYYDSSGKKVKKKHGKLSEGFSDASASSARQKILDKQKESPNFKNRRILFNDLVDAYLKSLQHKKEYKHITQNFNKVIIPYFKNIYVDQINVQALEDYINHLFNLTHGKHIKRKYAIKTIREYYYNIRSVFNYASYKGLIQGNLPKFKFTHKVRNEREKYLSYDEIIRLLKYIRRDKVFYNFVYISLNTGVRADSCLALRFSDVDFKNKRIRLYDSKEEEYYYMYLNDRILKFLTLLKKRNKIVNVNTYICNLDIEKYVYKTLYNRCQKYLNKLFNVGLEKTDSRNRAVFHTFRHTFASHLAINNVPIYTIKELMNHSDIKVTMRYAKLSSENKLQSVNTLYKS